MRSLKTNPECESYYKNRRHTTVATDHVAGGELFNDVRAVLAFRTHQSNIQVEPEGLLLWWLWRLLQSESHHLCVKTTPKNQATNGWCEVCRCVSAQRGSYAPTTTLDAGSLGCTVVFGINDLKLWRRSLVVAEAF